MTQLTDVADVLEIGTFVTFRTEKERHGRKRTSAGDEGRPGLSSNSRIIVVQPLIVEVYDLRHSSAHGVGVCLIRGDCSLEPPSSRVNQHFAVNPLRGHGHRQLSPTQRGQSTFFLPSS